MIGEAAGFETIVARRTLWPLLGWATRAVLAGSGSLLLLLGVVGAVLEVASPPLPGSPTGASPWQLTLFAAVAAAFLARVSARAVAALAAGTREVTGVLAHAKLLSHSGQRATYKLWHVVIEGQEYTFSPRELRGSGAARLRPGQRAVVHLAGGRELVRLAVDSGAPLPARSALPPPASEPAPLSERDIARVTAWASRRAGLLLAFVVGLGALVASRGGPVTALHAIFAVLIGGLFWAFAGAARTVRAARALVPGTATRYLDGALRHDAGVLRNTYLGTQRVGDAGRPRAPRLATRARARVVTLPVADLNLPETLVAVEWVAATD